MVHRTYVTFQLTALLMSQMRLEPDAPMRWMLYYDTASSLATAIRELVILNDNELMPCSDALRGVTRHLVALFGPVAGNITIVTRIQPLQLAAFKRRALVLVAIALLSNALIHAFRGLEGGRIKVQLARVSSSRARLIIEHSGRDKSDSVPRVCQQISRDLANLLEAEIVHGFSGLIGTAAQIDFPV
jgi:two-component sensor histidine kinase